MVDTTLLFEPLHTLARLLKNRKLSATAIAEASLSRIEQVNPKLGAFSAVTTERALREAAQADRELEAGLYRGPLHGITYVVHDLVAVKGVPQNCGTRQSSQEVCAADASLVKALQQAGGVLLGSCATGNLTLDTTASAQCRMPWNLRKQTQGPAAAVAAGLACFALGVETFGVMDASAIDCGVTALRPTFGRVSRVGIAPLSWTMDKVSILCRDARSAATLFALLQGRDPADLSTVDKPFKPTLTKAKEHAVGKRIGVVREDDAGQEAGQALREALEVFASMGAKIEDVTPPDHSYEALVTTIIAAEIASVFEQNLRNDEKAGSASPLWHGVIPGAMGISAVDYLRCQRLRSYIARDFAQTFQRYNVILGPGSADMATAAPPGPLACISALETAGNLLGLPAVTLPCGLSKSRSVLGMTIVGRPFAEAEVLETAHLYQSLTDWHTRRPEL